MQTTDLRWLTTTPGHEATAEASALLAAGRPLPTLIQQLRRGGGAGGRTPEQARAALQLAEGRRALAGRHPLATRLYADRDGAEQAAHAIVAAHTAQRFAGCQQIADLGCGIGADTIALARHAAVLAIDRDPARLMMTDLNTRLAAEQARADEAHAPFPVEGLAADLNEWSRPEAIDAVWIDPARRDTSGRRMDPEHWSPTLSRALALATPTSASTSTANAGAALRGGGVKVGPAIDLTLLPAEAEIECVSLDGGMRAVVVWLGAFVTAPRRATVLRSTAADASADTAGAAHLNTLTGDGARGRDVRPIGRTLYDPDPAVGRAGLVAHLGAQLGAWQLDAQTAYLSADHTTDTPFARRYRVLETLPFSERRLLRALRARATARVEVGRRGSPVDVNALERRLNAALPGGLPPGSEPTTVLLTQIGGAHTAIICVREREPAEALPGG